MANLKHPSLRSEFSFLQNPLLFEKQFKLMSNWSEEEWDSNKMLKEQFQKVINSCKFWNRRLQKAHSEERLLISTYSLDGKKVINESVLIDELEKLIDLNNISSIYEVRNSRILGIQFKDKNTKSYVEENLKLLDNDNVIYLKWFNQAMVLEIRIHWIPEKYCEKELIRFLELYVEIKDMYRERRKVRDKVFFNSTIITVSAVLKKDVLSAQIPHLFDLFGLQGLIVIRGREPVCLNCEQLGHKAYECPFKYCKECKKMVKKSHNCLESNRGGSYAEKLAEGLGKKLMPTVVEKLLWIELTQQNKLTAVIEEWEQPVEEANPHSELDKKNAYQERQTTKISDLQNKESEEDESSARQNNKDNNEKHVEKYMDWKREHEEQNDVDQTEEEVNTQHEGITTLEIKESLEEDNHKMDFKTIIPKRKSLEQSGNIYASPYKLNKKQSERTYSTRPRGVVVKNLFDNLSDQADTIFDSQDEQDGGSHSGNN